MDDPKRDEASRHPHRSSPAVRAAWSAGLFLIGLGLPYLWLFLGLQISNSSKTVRPLFVFESLTLVVGLVVALKWRRPSLLLGMLTAFALAVLILVMSCGGGGVRY